MMNTLSLLAGVFSALSMGIYFVKLLKGGSIPNPTTWVIWLAIGLMNAATYFSVVNGSLMRTLPLMIVIAGIIAVTTYSFVKSKFSPLSKIDVICFSIAVMVGIFWKTSGDPIRANLWLQLVYAISFIPTLIGLHRKNLHETAAPWVLALVSYSLMIYSIKLDWSNSSWVALVHPIVNGLIGNGWVAYYAITQSKKSKTMAEREAEAAHSILQALAQEERNYEHLKTNTWFISQK